MKRVVNRYRNAEFVLSVAQWKQLPAEGAGEVAFAGRSNVGKSSAINAITEQQKLARTGKTPGRTQQINYFRVADQTYLVDLPGYGYAKVPEAVKHHWQQLLGDYLNQRVSLCGLVLLMDIRHPLTEFDQQMLHWCTERGMPVHVLLTKADKLKFGAAKSALLQVQRQAQELVSIPLTVQLFSAHARQGLEQVWQQLDAWLFGEKKSPASGEGGEKP